MTKIATKADCNKLIANSFIATSDLTKCPTLQDLSVDAPLLRVSQSATDEQCIKLSNINVNYSVPLTIKVTNQRNVRINITYANIYACEKGRTNTATIPLGSVSFADVGANYTATRTVNIDLSKIKDAAAAAATANPNISLDKEIDLRVVVGKTTSNNRKWQIWTNADLANPAKNMTSDTPWVQVPLNYGAKYTHCITGGEYLTAITTFTFVCYD
jgi:hypothetical protein